MTASELAGAASFALIAGAALLSGMVEDPTAREALYFFGTAAVVWYVWKGHSLKGWVGDSYSDMLKEIQRLESLSAIWRHPDGMEVPLEDREKILQRQQRLREKILFHPDNPRNRN